MNNLFSLTSLISIHCDREGNYFFDDEDINETLNLMLYRISHEEDKKDEEKLTTRLVSLYHDISCVWVDDEEACINELHCFFNQLVNCVSNIKVACSFNPCVYSLKDHDEQLHQAIMMKTSLSSEFVSTASQVIRMIDNAKRNPWFQLENQATATFNELIEITYKFNCERKIFLLLQDMVKGGSNHVE